MRRLTPLPVAQWPDLDRAAWERARTPSAGLFDDAGAAAGLRPKTQRLYERAYGIWLAHLSDTGQCDPGEAPASRPTPERLDAWMASMSLVGHQPGTIRNYLTCLYSVLRLMAPEAALDFIIKPHGRPLSMWLPVTPKTFPPVDTEDVMRRARELHAAGLDQRLSPKARRMALRDAGLFALLARRAPRVGNIVAMRIGEHLLQTPDGRYRVRFSGDETKNHKALEWPLDRESSSFMAEYLCHGRPLFRGADDTAALWLSNQGGPLTAIGVAALVYRRTRAWFGEAVGPHTARKWLRTSAALRSPEAAFDAAEVSGHSVQVSLRHYAAAHDIGAAMRYGERLSSLRCATAGVAERAFAETSTNRACDQQEVDPS